MYKHTPGKAEIVAEEFNIVMIGDFNPKIFQPSWFSSENLIRESESESANLEIVHSDFTSFSTDWFLMQVAREKFNAGVKSAAYKTHLADLVIGTFQKLNHTPIHQMGLNLNLSLRFKSLEDWNSFGHFLLPKAPWSGLLNKPGMRSVSVNGPRDDDLPGYIQMLIDPVLHSQSDVTIRMNNHYERKDDDKAISAEFFVNIIENQYARVIEQSKSTIEELLKRFEATRNFDNGVDK